MTCVIGLKTKDRILMGADSAGVGGLDIEIRAMPKIFQNGKFMIGYTTSFRMGQLLQFEFNPPIQDEKTSDEKFMCVNFINAIRKCFKDGGFSEIDKNKEEGGIFIVAYKKQLYKIEGDFQVATIQDDFMVCGCGGNYALGALKVTQKLPPKERIKLALETAEYFSAGVRRPFIILEMKSKEKHG